jgi:hypothetical protein
MLKVKLIGTSDYYRLKYPIWGIVGLIFGEGKYWIRNKRTKNLENTFILIGEEGLSILKNDSQIQENISFKQVTKIYLNKLYAVPADT